MVRARQEYSVAVSESDDELEICSNGLFRKGRIRSRSDYFWNIEYSCVFLWGYLRQPAASWSDEVPKSAGRCHQTSWHLWRSSHCTPETCSQTSRWNRWIRMVLTVWGPGKQLSQLLRESSFRPWRPSVKLALAMSSESGSGRSCRKRLRLGIKAAAMFVKAMWISFLDSWDGQWLLTILKPGGEKKPGCLEVELYKGSKHCDWDSKSREVKWLNELIDASYPLGGNARGLRPNNSWPFQEVRVLQGQVHNLEDGRADFNGVKT